MDGILYEESSTQTLSDFIPIASSAAKSWFSGETSEEFGPASAYDGDYRTFYAVRNGDAIGNFLQLVLSQKYRIETVRITNREDCCKITITGTAVSVFDSVSKTEVQICGEITGNKISICRR